MSGMDLNIWVSPTEAARIANTNRMRIYRYIKRGVIKQKGNGLGTKVYLPDVVYGIDEYKHFDAAIRFLSQVDIEGDCWIWKGNLNQNGYGSFCANGYGKIAHRVSYRLFHGEIPEGKIICHHCDNPPCVNPDHIYAGTHKDNTRDSWEHGNAWKQRGVKNGMAKLNPQKVREIRKRYIPHRHGLKKLANEYGVTSGAIQGVVSGRTWTHVD